MKREIYQIPHMQVGAVRIEEVPPDKGLSAYRNFLATTACGLERNTTLCTRTTQHVRCSDCWDAMQRIHEVNP